jgi:hypothetical protein
MMPTATETFHVELRASELIALARTLALQSELEAAAGDARSAQKQALRARELQRMAGGR